MDIPSEESDAIKILSEAEALIEVARGKIKEFPYRYYLGFSRGFEEYSLVHTYRIGPEGKYKSGSMISENPDLEKLYFNTYRSAESALEYYSSKCGGNVCGGLWNLASLLEIQREMKDEE